MYELSFFSFVVIVVNNEESFENQDNFNDSSSNIHIDAKKNAKESKLVTKASSSFNDDAMMTKDLDYEEEMNDN